MVRENLEQSVTHTHISEYLYLNIDIYSLEKVESAHLSTARKFSIKNPQHLIICRIVRSGFFVVRLRCQMINPYHDVASTLHPSSNSARGKVSSSYSVTSLLSQPVLHLRCLWIGSDNPGFMTLPVHARATCATAWKKLDATKKERGRERQRRKKTNIEEWPREHRSIDRKTKGDGQLVALFRRRIEPREHFYVEEDEWSSADRTNASLRYRLRGPLDVTLADRTLAFRAVYEQHYGSVTALRRLVTRNFATPRDLFARRLVPAAGIRPR